MTGEGGPAYSSRRGFKEVYDRQVACRALTAKYAKNAKEWLGGPACSSRQGFKKGVWW